MRHHKHRHHSGLHHHPDRHFGERRFAHDPLDVAFSLGGRHRHARGGRHPEGRYLEGGHEGGRRRVFDHGDLRFILLSMIAARPAHGYDLMKALEDRIGGGYSPSPGVIYPTLTMLEEQGFARITAEDGKKLYQATAEGEAFLAANQDAVASIQARIDAIARVRQISPDPRIIRAIQNLKTALRLRLAGEPLPDDRIRAIAASIDAAAAEVECT